MLSNYIIRLIVSCAIVWVECKEIWLNVTSAIVHVPENGNHGLGRGQVESYGLINGCLHGLINPDRNLISLTLPQR